MDEPTSSLDAAPARQLERLAHDLTARGVTVLWVTHDLAQAERIADHHIVLLEGTIASTARAAEFLEQDGADELE
jgi:erythritol transport system ATP-binding protein